jgi:hypothetical protein
MDDKMKMEDEGEQEVNVKGNEEKKQRQFLLIITTISLQVTQSAARSVRALLQKVLILPVNRRGTNTPSVVRCRHLHQKCVIKRDSCKGKWVKLSLCLTN